MTTHADRERALTRQRANGRGDGAVGRLSNARTTGYDVTPDGSQFLVIEPVEKPGALPTRVILGWREELIRRVPRK